MSAKPTLSVDFDGPTHLYAHGWDGGKITDMTPGAKSWLTRLAKTYRVVITTARTDLTSVRKAIESWGLSDVIADVSNVKPPAVAYIDDKAVHFSSWGQAIADLQDMTGEKV